MSSGARSDERCISAGLERNKQKKNNNIRMVERKKVNYISLKNSSLSMYGQKMYNQKYQNQIPKKTMQMEQSIHIQNMYK